MKLILGVVRSNQHEIWTLNIQGNSTYRDVEMDFVNALSGPGDG